MNRAFGPNTPLMRFMAVVADLFYVNVLWLLCCIPLITAGASTTALYAVTMKTAKGVDGEIRERFFSSFKQNFKQATIIHLAVCVLSAIFCVDLYIYLNTDNMPGFVLIGLIIMAVLLILFSTWVYPILAQFDNTTMGTIKNTFGMVFAHPIQTVLLVLLNALIVFVTTLLLIGRVLWLFIWILMAGSVSAYFNSFIINHCFRPYTTSRVEDI